MSLRPLQYISLIIAFGSTAFAQVSAPVTLPPLDGQERVKFLVVDNLGVAALLENVAIGAVQTAENTPKEYGPHWEGFGKRVGLVTGNYAVKSVMEVGIGSLWERIRGMTAPRA